VGNTLTLNIFQKLDHCFTVTVFFIVLQEVADSESRFIFTDITVGAYDSQWDGTFSASTLYHILKDFKYTLLKSTVLMKEEQKCLLSSLVIRLIL